MIGGRGNFGRNAKLIEESEDSNWKKQRKKEGRQKSIVEWKIWIEDEKNRKQIKIGI
jgi:hypothetical protein